MKGRESSEPRSKSSPAAGVVLLGRASCRTSSIRRPRYRHARMSQHSALQSCHSTGIPSRQMVWRDRPCFLAAQEAEQHGHALSGNDRNDPKQALRRTVASFHAVVSLERNYFPFFRDLPPKNTCLLGRFVERRRDPAEGHQTGHSGDAADRAGAVLGATAAQESVAGEHHLLLLGPDILPMVPLRKPRKEGLIRLPELAHRQRLSARLGEADAQRISPQATSPGSPATTRCVMSAMAGEDQRLTGESSGSRRQQVVLPVGPGAAKPDSSPLDSGLRRNDGGVIWTDPCSVPAGAAGTDPLRRVSTSRRHASRHIGCTRHILGVPAQAGTRSGDGSRQHPRKAAPAAPGAGQRPAGATTRREFGYGIFAEVT